MKKYKLQKPENVNDFNTFFPYEEKHIKYYNPEIAIKKFTINTAFSLSPIISIFKKLKTIFSGKKGVILKQAYFIINQHSNNYYHWLNDICPKLFFLEQKKVQDYILIPAKLYKKEFIKATCESFDLNYKIIKENEIIISKKLYIVKHVADNGAQNPELLRGVVHKIKNYFKISPQLHHKKVFITRKNAPNRRTLPFGELEFLMQEQGFNVVESEKLTFYEQVKLFNETKILIGVHGAGLTNMLFMPKGSNLVEIKTKTDPAPNFCYYFMANALKHRYHSIIGDSATHKRLQDTDIIITDQILSKINEII